MFTNHTPEEGGNPGTEIWLLEKAGFFSGLPITEVRAISGITDSILNHTLAALQMSRVANGVSRLHQQTLGKMWKSYPGICSILSVTNAQNAGYWSDKEMCRALKAGDDAALRTRKPAMKERLFEIVADENGEIFGKEVLTIVFAKRFAGFKRADLLLHDMERFNRLVVIPMYYDYPSRWTAIMKEGMRDIFPYFDSGRMAAEYYDKLYVT